MYFQFSVIVSIRKHWRGERRIQFHRDMKCISDCIYLFWELHRGESKIQFHRDMKCILDLISHWKLHWGECKIRFHRNMGWISVLLYLYLIGSSAGEDVECSTTRVWNVAVFISCWKLRWGECKIQFHKDMECILDWNYLLLKDPLGRVLNTVPKDIECISGCHYILMEKLHKGAPNTVPQGYGMYSRLSFYLA